MKRFLFVAAGVFGLALAASAAPRIGPVWLKGDLHVHDDHSSDGSLPRQRAKDKAKGNVSVADQIGQGERQGLQFMPLTDHRTFDQYYDPLWESSKLLLIPGEEANGSPHAIALGGADSIVQGASRNDRAAFTHVQQSVWDAHSQGAIWSVAHPDDGETDKDTGVPNAMANVQGMDLVETWNHASDLDKEIAYAEGRWDLGFRFGMAGASDNHFKEYWDFQGPSLPTTHVLAAAYNERGVLEGIRAGHTSISWYSNGPFLTLTSDIRNRGSAAAPIGGDEVFTPAGTKGHLILHVQRAAGLQVLVYRAPGKSAGPFKTFSPTKDDETFTVDITTGEADWFRAEVRGPSTPTPTQPSVIELKAEVSPIFFSPGPVAARPDIPIPSDAGIDDGAQLAAGDKGAFSGFPDVAVEGGVSHVVSEVHGPATSVIVYRRRDAKGVWSRAAIPLSGPALARFPKVAAHGGDVWVTWQEDAQQIPHRPQIMLAHSADGGSSWQKVQTVRAMGGRAEHPDIAIAADGKPVLVWQEIQAAQPFDVMEQEVGTDAAPRNLSREGKTFGPGQPDDTRTARYPASVWPAVSVAPDGRIAVAWEDDRTDPDPLWTGTVAGSGTNPDDWQIQVVTRPAAGAWDAVVSLGSPAMADRHPDLTFGGKGELVVAWETKTLNAAGANLSVLAAVSTNGGASFAAPVTLGADPKTMSERPRLGVDADGSVRAVWYDSRSADWRWRVMTAHLGAGGWDAGALLNGKGINSWPATAGGMIVFASTRGAARLQRDQTQQVFLLPAVR